MAGPEKQTFAGYEIIAKLGQGGMGAVYKARQPALDRLIALKVMASDLATDRDFVARFKREASIAASLSHPNVVQVYSAGESEGTHYIAMEFVDGQTLRDHIEQNGRLDPREAIAITVYVAEALQYAWNRAKLIHRDIKPENIFLSRTGEVKVGDLGLAKTVGGQTTSLTQTGTAMGSPHYISPEQATGAKEMDFRTDIYSLGGTLYHMLTGQTPYSGDSSMVVMMKHVNEPPPAIFKVWPQCPMPLGLLVGKMLAKNRSSRPASYEELIEQLRGLHDKLKPATVPAAAPVSPSDPTQLLTPTPKPVVTKTPTVAPKARESKPVTRNSKLVIGAGALAAVMAIAGAVWWFADSGGGPKFLDLGGGVKMELVAIPPGQFMLGSTAVEKAWSAAQPNCGPVTNEGDAPCKATIKQRFWMGRTETTFGQWKQFVNATGYKTEVERFNLTVHAYDPAQKKWADRKGVNWRDPGFGFAMQDNHPACCLTWSDAMAFCDWLSQREQTAGRLPAGYKFRLPTEAEWEYACRAETQTRFWWGDNVEDAQGRVNWAGDEDGFECVHPVDHYGARGRNAFGLADMIGNVPEWCLDGWDPNGAHEEYYVGPPDGRAMRGAAFWHLPGQSRCASRCGPHNPSAWSGYGFRVCLGPDVLGSAAAAPAATAEPQAAPPAAISPKFGVLFDGRDTSAWQHPDGSDCQWEVKNGALVAGKNDLDTREKFQDFKLHIEFAVPRDAKQGNSGIYLQGRYEVQILDSFGKPADDACCGAIFRLRAPTENASKPPDEWQTFDIGFRAAQFDAAGNKTANARISVLHNGKLIHDYAEIPKSTGKGEPESAAPGPIRLQSYGSPVRFRNISIRPVDEVATQAVPAGFVSLFNGKDLTGWEGRPEFWSVQDGAICGATTKETRARKNTFLVCTAGEFGDFELRAQFKMAAGNEQDFANSGIQYRSQIIDREYFTLSGYQADLGVSSKKNLCGGFWDEASRNIPAEPGQRLILREGVSPKSPKKTDLPPWLIPCPMLVFSCFPSWQTGEGA
jgi:serine/threonine-protein kinase